MNTQSGKSNHVLIIFLIYLLPILFWVFYTFHETSLTFSWPITIVGLLLLCFGTAILFALFNAKEEPAIIPLAQEEEISLPETVLPIPDETPKFLQEIDLLQKNLQEKSSLIAKSDAEMLKVKEENQAIKEKLQSLNSNLAEKDEDSRRKIEELNLENHHKQQAIQQLENQIHDLRYEIKTLLQLTEVDYSAFTEQVEPKIEAPHLPIEEWVEEPPLTGQVTSEEDARRLLKRCLDIAQKMTPGYQASSLRSLSADPYAFDLRRLGDSLRLEPGALILVYSPKDERILFANAQTKTLLGWGSDKFTQDFSSIIAESLPIWKSSVSQLLTKSEVNLTLTCKTKNDELVPLNTLIGSIPTGVFRSLVIGIVY